jgi:hypothetical protein
MVPYSNLCCHFHDCQVLMLCDGIIYFSLVSPGRDSFQATTVGLRGNMCVPIFKVLYTSSDTASAYTVMLE